MKIRIKSHIVGFKQPPGTVLVVGKDITEKTAKTLLSMGKEAELVPEDLVDIKKPDGPADATKTEGLQGIFSESSATGREGNDNPPDPKDANEKTGVRTKADKNNQATS